MARKLDSKIALVTGATSGIGPATAQRFAAEGAHVYLTGRRQAELDAAVKGIQAAGGNATGVRVDSTKLDELDALYAQIKEEQGRLDVVRERRRRFDAAARRHHRRTLRRHLRIAT